MENKKYEHVRGKDAYGNPIEEILYPSKFSDALETALRVKAHDQKA